MKKTLLFLTLIGCCLTLFSQNTLFVDCKGSSPGAHLTIQAAVNAASASNVDVIKVAKGTYSEAVQLQKKVQLLGGFAGGGDFNTANPQANPTIIKGTPAAPCIYVDFENLSNSGTLTISGFTVQDGQRGIEITNGWSANTNNITIKENIIENNGVQNDSQMGGGIVMTGTNITIENNIIRNNKAGKGAGIGSYSNLGSFFIAGNRIENNTGYSDHGGGVYISDGTGMATQNIFNNNIIGQNITWGWGGAIVITGYTDTTKLVTLSHNVYSNNKAPDHGGAVFVDDMAKVRMENELLYKNTTGRSGSAIFVDADGAKQSSVLEMNNCTVSDNTASGGGAALYVQGSIARVQNCIFWNNGNDFEAMDDPPATANLTVNYTLTQQGYSGTGNFSSNPLFANPQNGDFHLQSKGGRFDPATQQFVIDNAHSPAIDAGNPTSNYSNEPAPNGNRVNMGCYGNTPQASKSGEVGIGETQCIASIKVFPNPTTGELRIDNGQLTMNNEQFSMNNIEIYDIMGKKQEIILNSQLSILNCSHLSAGAYFLRIGNETVKIIKQ